MQRHPAKGKGGSVQALQKTLSPFSTFNVFLQFDLKIWQHVNMRTILCPGYIFLYCSLEHFCWQKIQIQLLPTCKRIVCAVPDADEKLISFLYGCIHC